MEVLKAILAALVGLLVIFACIAWAIAAVLGPLAIIKLHGTAEANTGSADIGEEETQCEPIST